MTHQHKSSFHNKQNQFHQQKQTTCACFGDLKLKNHPHHKPSDIERPASSEEILDAWNKVKYELWETVRQRGLPRELTPQKGVVFHTVNAASYAIDVLDIPLLHLQTDGNQNLTLPCKRMSRHSQVPSFLITTRPECHRLLESYRLYLLNYAHAINTLLMSILKEKLVLKVSVTCVELENVMFELRENLWRKYLNITPDQVDDQEWLKLW